VTETVGWIGLGGRKSSRSTKPRPRRGGTSPIGRIPAPRPGEGPEPPRAVAALDEILIPAHDDFRGPGGKTNPEAAGRLGLNPRLFIKLAEENIGPTTHTA